MSRLFIWDISNENPEDYSKFNLPKEKLALTERLKFSDDFDHTVMAWNFLKKCIEECGYNFEKLHFDIKDGQKPKCDGGFDFNIAHSADLIVVAIDPKQIGVDVEQIDFSRKLGIISKRILSQEEFAHFNSLNTKNQCYYFYEKWTEKESKMKFYGISVLNMLKEKQNSFENLKTETKKIVDDHGNEYILSITTFKD